MLSLSPAGAAFGGGSAVPASKAGVPCPPLPLLLFADGPQQPHEDWQVDEWASTKPPSYTQWAYRDCPWHVGGTCASPSLSLRETSQSRCRQTPSRASPDSKPRSTSACDSVGSTRVPSRASPDARASAWTGMTSLSAGEQRSSSSTAPAGPGSLADASPRSPALRRPKAPPVRSRFGRPRCRAPGPGPFRGPGGARPGGPSSEAMALLRGACEPQESLGAELSSSSAWQVTSRDPGPATDALAWLSSSAGGSTFSVLSEQFAAAAELAGARARGPVAAAIREKVMQRHANASAFRRRMYLGSDFDEYDIDDEEGSAEVSPDGADGDFDAGGGDGAEGAGGEADDNSSEESEEDDERPVDVSDSAPWLHESYAAKYGGLPQQEAPRRRPIRVSKNTCLGRMIDADPARATRHRLVSVPAWQHNRPWPPPTVRSKRRVPGGLPSLGGPRVGNKPKKEDTSENKFGLKLNLNLRGTKPEGLLKSPRHTHRKGSVDHKPSEVSSMGAFTPSTEVKVDLHTAESLLGLEEIEHYRDVYVRFSMGTGGKLRSKGLQLAMKTVGLGFPESHSEQLKVRAVQEAVLKHYRNDDNEAPNPLTSSKGYWELAEFLLMVAGVFELERHDKFSGHKDLANEVGMDMSMVQELAALFKEHDENMTKTITFTQFQRILARCDLRPTQDELKVIVSTEVPDDLTFEDFVRYIGALNSFMPIDLKRLILPHSSSSGDHRPQAKQVVYGLECLVG
mmetsp:Transcript_1284/g.5261  ORF Transcript_1284/g.5261 Transcript_1284/m.5261 type:complete len:739 (-) Transcript_1284:430-2646(-)